VPALLVAILVGGIALLAGVSAPCRLALAAPGLSVAVRGNQLIDGDGVTIQLRGVNGYNVVSPCINGYGPIDGPPALDSQSTVPDSAAAATVAPLEDWGINAVRLQLNEDCWLGVNSAPPNYSGSHYRQVIANYVTTLTDRGLRVILDLHWTAPGTILSTMQDELPDADHALDFWQSVARTFGSDPAVMFDLFNEPKPSIGDVQHWKCWRDGCTLASDYPGHPIYQAAGMQSLIDVVRSTGAANVLLLGGLGYAGSFYDDGNPPMARWESFLPRDPLGQIVASIHIYPYTYCHTVACWQANIGPVAKRYPVVAGEVGEGDGSANYPSCDGSFLTGFMNWADMVGVSYMAWTWNTWGNCAALIGDFDGTPVNHGVAFKQHLTALEREPAPTVAASAGRALPAPSSC
jgi:endoglucanase